MPVILPEPVEEAVPEASDGWTVVDLTAATILDPSVKSSGAPVDEGNGYYTVTYDTTAKDFDTGDMVAHVVEAADLDWSQTFILNVAVWVDSESSLKLVGACFACNSNTNLGASKGFWGGLSEDSLNGPDAWARKMTESLPITASESADYALLILTIRHSPQQSRADISVYDLDSGGLTPVYQDYLGAPNEMTSPPTSGPVYVGILSGNRALGTEDSYRTRLAYSATLLPTP